MAVRCLVPESNCTLRVTISIRNSVWCVTGPRAVQTSVVKKSAAAMTAACDLMKVLQLDGRSGAGAIPCSFKTLAIVERAT